MLTTQLILPDLFTTCPYDLAVNPHYDKASKESRDWLEQYEAFTGDKKAIIRSAEFELLVCYCYPHADYGQFKACCDFLNLLFYFDEVSDDQDFEGAKYTGEVFINALTDPDWIDGSKIARMTKDFRGQFVKYAGPHMTRRFFERAAAYIQTVVNEASFRERGDVMGIREYIGHRRENGGVTVCFVLIEMSVGVDLPDEVFEDPAFAKCYLAAVDHVSWANDLYSYAMELAKGCEGNITKIGANRR